MEEPGLEPGEEEGPRGPWRGGTWPGGLEPGEDEGPRGPLRGVGLEPDGRGGGP